MLPAEGDAEVDEDMQGDVEDANLEEVDMEAEKRKHAQEARQNKQQGLDL